MKLICVSSNTQYFLIIKLNWKLDLTNHWEILNSFDRHESYKYISKEDRSVWIRKSKNFSPNFLFVSARYSIDYLSSIFFVRCVVNKKNSRGENCKGSMEERDLFDRGMYACNKRILDVGRSALRFSFGSFSFGRIADEIAWSGPIVGGHKQSLTVRGRSPNRFPPTAKAIPIKPPFLKRVSI